MMNCQVNTDKGQCSGWRSRVTSSTSRRLRRDNDPVSQTDPTGQYAVTWCDQTVWWEQWRNCYIYISESTVLREMHTMEQAGAFATFCWAVSAGLLSAFCGGFDAGAAGMYGWFDVNNDGHAELMTIYEWRSVGEYWWWGWHHWDSAWHWYWVSLSPA
jgi:hypothetical protein